MRNVRCKSFGFLLRFTASGCLFGNFKLFLSQRSFCLFSFKYNSLASACLYLIGCHSVTGCACLNTIGIPSIPHKRLCVHLGMSFPVNPFFVLIGIQFHNKQRLFIHNWNTIHSLTNACLYSFWYHFLINACLYLLEYHFVINACFHLLEYHFSMNACLY